jgi:hypothetical protein
MIFLRWGRDIVGRQVMWAVLEMRSRLYRAASFFIGVCWLPMWSLIVTERKCIAAQPACCWFKS